MKTLFTLFILCASFLLHAQNLVPNGDFEGYSSLPSDGGQWHYVTTWTNAGGTPVNGYYGDPDFFHTGGSGPVKLPNTALATVHPHGGDAIMGFLGYHDPTPGLPSTNIREYLMIELSNPLSVGGVYEISFWTINGESGMGHYYQCDGIGVNLSTTPLQQSGNTYIPRSPQLEVAGELFTTEWTEHSFIFAADSSYRYLTIGNFYPDSATNRSVAVSGPLPFAGAYYFVDDVSVTVTKAAGLADSAVPEFSIHPNPAHDRVQLRLTHSTGNKNFVYQLYSMQGKVLRSGQFYQYAEVDIADLAAGMYIVEIKGDRGIILQRRMVKL